MQKYSIKYWQIKLKNTSEKSFAMIKTASSIDSGMVQHMEICQCNINKLKNENHLIISLDVFNKIQHNFMIKVLERAGIKGINLNIINTMYNKPTSN